MVHVLLLNMFEGNFQWWSKKPHDTVSGHLKWEWQLGETERPGCLPCRPSVSALSLTRLGQADSWHTAVVTENWRGGGHMETEWIVELAQAQQGRVTGTRAAMTWVCVCVCTLYLGGGGGRERVTYGLWVRRGVYAGMEEISGIASQCSCPAWETQRNRYMVHVFQVGGKKTEREREADIFFFFLFFAEKHPRCPKE